ncbi:MAG: hypothetical protein QF767_05670, partial [Alphaproteobacteria bacterium]|nr:hypothetical protein [Alphaproteobacteria bacterium]
MGDIHGVGLAGENKFEIGPGFFMRPPVQIGGAGRPFGVRLERHGRHPSHRQQRQADRDQYFLRVKENARQTREKILKFLMIRRTRNEIEKYYGEDLKRQGFK